LCKYSGDVSWIESVVVTDDHIHAAELAVLLQDGIELIE